MIPGIQCVVLSAHTYIKNFRESELDRAPVIDHEETHFLAALLKMHCDYRQLFSHGRFVDERSNPRVAVAKKTVR